MKRPIESNYRALSRAAPQQNLINDGDYMTENNAQSEAGLASDLNRELDSLLEMANDYLNSQKEGRFAPCNPDFLIKHLAINAKRLVEYEKRLLWIADFIANNNNKTVIDVFGECCCPMHVIQNIDDAMANRI